MKFAEAYKQLNVEQKRAVDAIDGPLLVIAGPGTGKTQLLSARAANILQKTDVNPENILCLTFTDKAATEMRERMLEQIGPEARKIAVHTFHGLGGEIINTYPDYFWDAARLEPAPDAVKLEVVETILSKLPLKSPLALKFAGQSTVVGDVDKAIKRAKEAGLTPGKLAAIVSANLAYIKEIEPKLQPLLEQTISKATVEQLQKAIDKLPEEGTDKAIAPIPPLSRTLKHSFTRAHEAAQESGKNTPVSTWKGQISEVKQGRRVLRDRARNEWWAELAAVYEKYQAEMSQRRYYDFADMILETITQIEQQESLRADLSERYQYIMIDEFQDTNDAQFRLAYLIASHPAQEGKPNIMAVGDDDQAIYRFQGAELSNVQGFMDSFVDTKKVVLTDNYRSHQSVLDTVAQVSAKIERRLVDELPGLNKTLHARGRVGQGSIEHFLYPNQVYELTEVVKRIKSQQGNSKGETAVLARGHKSLEKLTQILSEQGIPVRYERSNNVLEHEAVGVVTRMMLLLQAITDGNRVLVSHLLSTLLPHPMWQLDPKELWKFATANRGDSSDWLTSLTGHKDKQFRAVGDWLLELTQVASHDPLTVVMEYVLGLREGAKGFRSPLHGHYLESKGVTDQYVRTLSALRHLRRLADEFANAREATLENFNEFIRLNREHNVTVADESVFTTAPRAVQLMTVHKAKGLEFDTVFVIDAIDADWRPRRQRRKPPMNLESLQEYGEDMDDYARLLYVALSRAKRNIYMTSYRQSEEGKDVLPTPLLLEQQAKELAEKDLASPTEVLEQNFTWPQLDQPSAQLALTSVLENYELPVTSLLNFLDITRGGPQHFLERNLLRLPDVKKPRQAFGTAIHEALATAQRLTNSGKLRPKPVMEDFQQTLRDAHLEKDDEERYLIHGEQLLERLLDWKAFTLPKGSEPERVIEHVRLDQATIRGSIDRLDISKDELHVVDYKTGAPLKGLLTSETKGEGVKAWRNRVQLIFYALLLREQGRAKPQQAVTGSMIYLEADEERMLTKSYIPTDTDLQRLRELIEAVWRHVQKVDMPDISGYSQDLNGIKKFENDLIEGKV